MSDIKIDKNVPLPEGYRTYSKYPFGDMEVGDSFFTTEPRGKVYSAASYYGKRDGKKFATRKVEGGHRIWRIE